MSTETTRPGLARTIRDSVRHGPFGPLTPDEAREAADAARAWLLARLTDDDVVGHAIDAGADALGYGPLPETYIKVVRAALSAAAAVIGGEA